MTIRKVLLSAIFVGISSVALAQADSPRAMDPAPSTEMGTPDQQAACRPDVRKFCSKINAAGGPMAYLGCLKENRAKLSSTCRTMLESHGQ